MGFFHPGQLVWLVLAAAVPFLYWAVRRRTVDVSSRLIWGRTQIGQSAWRRWQRILSACIVAALLAVLAASLAEPYWRSDRAAARTIVVVLVAAPPNDDVHQTALEAVEKMKMYERMAIVTASEPTRVLCPLTSDPTELRKAIETQQKDSVPSVSAGKRLAEWMLAVEPNPTIIICPEPASHTPPRDDSSQPAQAPGGWLLAGALAVCATEWVLCTRRVTV